MCGGWIWCWDMVCLATEQMQIVISHQNRERCPWEVLTWMVLSNLRDKKKVSVPAQFLGLFWKSHSVLLCIFMHIRSHKTRPFGSTTKTFALSRAFLVVSVVSGEPGQAQRLCVPINFNVASSWVFKISGFQHCSFPKMGVFKWGLS